MTQTQNQLIISTKTKAKKTRFRRPSHPPPDPLPSGIGWDMRPAPVRFVVVDVAKVKTVRKVNIRTRRGACAPQCCTSQISSGIERVRMSERPTRRRTMARKELEGVGMLKAVVWGCVGGHVVSYYASSSAMVRMGRG